MDSIKKYNEIIDEYGSWEEYLKQLNMGKMKELYIEEQQRQAENLPAINSMLADLKKETKDLHMIIGSVSICYNKLMDENITYCKEEFFADMEYILEKYQNLK